MRTSRQFLYWLAAFQPCQPSRDGDSACCNLKATTGQGERLASPLAALRGFAHIAGAAMTDTTVKGRSGLVKRERLDDEETVRREYPGFIQRIEVFGLVISESVGSGL